MRVRLVTNPSARLGHAGAAVQAALALRDVECVGPDVVATTLDAIVVAGGDGTVVSQIADAMAHALPIGVVPLGTFNDLAHTLAIPFDIDAACDTIAGGATRHIDVGRVNGVYFVNEASIGISARIARRQTTDLKRRFGIFGIIGTTLQAFPHIVPFGVRLQHDGACERFRTIQLTIANSNRFGSIWNVRDAAIDDGWLDGYSVSLLGVRRFRSAAFEVTTRNPHRIVADGEPAGRTPARFDLLPVAIRILVPSPGVATALNPGTF